MFIVAQVTYYFFFVLFFFNITISRSWGLSSILCLDSFWPFYLFLPQSLIRFGDLVLIHSIYVRATVQLLLSYLATLQLPADCKAITVQLLPSLFRL